VATGIEPNFRKIGIQPPQPGELGAENAHWLQRFALFWKLRILACSWIREQVSVNYSISM